MYYVSLAKNLAKHSVDLLGYTNKYNLSYVSKNKGSL